MPRSNRRQSRPNNAFVERVNLKPLMDDKTGKHMPAGNLISVDLNKDEYLLGDGSICKPENFNGQIKNQSDNTKRKPKPTKIIETDPEATVDAPS